LRAAAGYGVREVVERSRWWWTRYSVDRVWWTLSGARAYDLDKVVGDIGSSLVALGF
jgi:hypothetical protein